MTEWIVSSSALIAIVLLVRFLLRSKLSLRVRYMLWLLVLVRLLVPVSFGESELSVLNALDTPAPAIGQSVPIPDGVQIFDPAGGFPSGTGIPTVTFPVGEAPTLSPEVNLDPNSVDPLSLLWPLYLLGAVLTAAALLFSNLRFARTLRRSRRRADALAPLPVYLSDAIPTPCLFGLFRPAIYLTGEAAEDAAPFAIAHELTHYRHGDHIWSALRGVCLVLHWYNPLVWYAAFASRADAELACDESAIKTLGESERVSYARTLIRLTSETRQSVLTAATTMTDSAKGLKARIATIVKAPHMSALTAALVLLVSLFAVGCTFTDAPVPEDVTLYPYGELNVAIPNELVPKLVIRTGEELGDSELLISVTQKASLVAARAHGIEDSEGLGWLFAIRRYTRAEYERWLCADGSGQQFFATDGEWYYCKLFPTDVRFFPMSDDPSEREHWEYLNETVVPAICDDFITRNDLEAFDGSAFFEQEFTYDSPHRYINFYPYYAASGSKEESCLLVLSQPVKQGEDGIWCVERMIDNTYGSVYPWFPDAGIPAADYYAQLQLECDAGTRDYIDPLHAAHTFVLESGYFDSGVADGSFEETSPAETVKTVDTSSPAALFSSLATLRERGTAPAVGTFLSPAGGSDKLTIYDAWTSNNDLYCLNNLALYTFEELPNSKVKWPADTARITLQSSDNSWRVDFWDNSTLLELTAGGETRLYNATSPYSDSDSIGAFVRLWYDEAELHGLGGHYSAQNIVIENRGQDYLTAAEEYCEEFEGRRKLTTTGSRFRFTYIDCIIEPAEETTAAFRERGEIGENTYAFYLTTVFVPETQLALDYSMAGNTGEYTGSDPNVPDGAYEYYRCGFITLEKDGWHGNLVGTGW